MKIEFNINFCITVMPLLAVLTHFSWSFMLILEKQLNIVSNLYCSEIRWFWHL